MGLEQRLQPAAAHELYLRDPSYPGPRDLVHVSVFSGTSFNEMVSFYQVVLNMRVVLEINSKIRLTLLSHDDENHRIGIVEIPNLEKRSPNTVRIEHTSWRYNNLQDLLATVRHVEQEIGLFPSAIHQGTLIALSYKDPDDNRCELIVECLPTQPEIIDFYKTVLDRNPGFNTLLSFDLRGMLRHQDAGTSLEELLDYDWVKDNLPV